ncbi:MAG: BREX-1 system adenine-specific DNA-methyltransferase PglX [Trueperaceae bacterium]|nr:BREX-1 system adenine-specific DNA-methyltransferase PglX [Trueperaceae bacterium]
MDRGALKRFASWARLWLREQMRVKARALGLGAKELEEPSFVSGGMSVAGFTFGAHQAGLYRQVRAELDERMRAGATYADALDAILDEMAFTWFNRFTALRYLEVNEYGVRALSHPQEGVTEPALLQGANSLASAGQLPGVTIDMLQAWQRQGQDATYQGVLNAYCRSLGSWLPFLFNPRQDIAELFLPDRLLMPGTIVRRIVTDVPEEDWRQIEVIGWLYQFYIADRKDEVFAKKGTYTPRDIPPATQLFTPHWIVRYMVENSVGRLWLESHPNSSLREHMPYYLDPNDAPSDGQGEGEEEAQGLASMPDRPAGAPLQPQDITVMDPACGSGHILVYAFDLLFRIYQEAGYATHDIPGLILEHNLHGLDIDLRAAQLANFAVTMKAREHTKSVQTEPQPLHVHAIEHTRGITLPDTNHLTKAKWEPLVDAFRHADELGSLIAPSDNVDLDDLQGELDAYTQAGHLETSSLAPGLQHLLQQARLLASKYHAVITNPPYMGSKAFSRTLKDYTRTHYPMSKADLFAVFIERNRELANAYGLVSMVTMHAWMFLSGFEALRRDLLSESPLLSMVHMGNMVMRIAFGTCAFIFRPGGPPSQLASFTWIRSQDLDQEADGPISFPVRNVRNAGAIELAYWRRNSDFSLVPGAALAYWLTPTGLDAFSLGRLDDIAEMREGVGTRQDDRFIRFIWEPDLNSVGVGPNFDATWLLTDKAGGYRKWRAEPRYVMKWQNNGQEIRNLRNPNGSLKSRPQNTQYFYRAAVSWGKVTSGVNSFRHRPPGWGFNDAAPSAFGRDGQLRAMLAFLNSVVARYFIEAQGPTINLTVGVVGALPAAREVVLAHELAVDLQRQCEDLVASDDGLSEVSHDFQEHPIVRQGKMRVADAFEAWRVEADKAFCELKRLEEENNRYWIDAYGLQDELSPEVDEDEVTIRRADWDGDVRSLISYAVGCMMGRYTLSGPGLQFAGGVFNLSDFEGSYLPDANGILPMTDEPYFEDDIVTRFTSWLEAAFGPEHVQENLRWIADALTMRASETPHERMRRYFLTEFIKDHNRQYSKRPIYWLFTSGKHGGFHALVYLHRYTPDTLARLRSDYALPLDAKLQAAIRDAEYQAEHATSASAKNRAEKLVARLRAQHEELQAYQEALQHHADQRISLDLDDGVAYNYTLLADLLYQGSDLPLKQLLKASQWKRDLLKQESTT